MNFAFLLNALKSLTYNEPRIALILRTEMSILRDDKIRPLFLREAIVTKLAVTQSSTRYQMKAMDITFAMIPH